MEKKYRTYSITLVNKKKNRSFVRSLSLSPPKGWMKNSTVLIPLPSLIKKKNRSFVRSFSLSLPLSPEVLPGRSPSTTPCKMQP